MKVERRSHILLQQNLIPGVIRVLSWLCSGVLLIVQNLGSGYAAPMGLDTSP